MDKQVNNTSSKSKSPKVTDLNFKGNPCNASKEPGGSSGGEAALIGKGGSLVGMGNDLGGSLRQVVLLKIRQSV